VSRKFSGVVRGETGAGRNPVCGHGMPSMEVGVRDSDGLCRYVI
jgi:hypothetical protein